MIPFTSRRLDQEPCATTLPDWPLAIRFTHSVISHGDASIDDHDELDGVTDTDDEDTDGDDRHQDTVPVMRITEPAYQRSMRELTRRRPEHAGIFAGPKDTDLITHFFEDERGKPSLASFTLDAAWLNEIIRQFLRCGIDVKGVVHSHPSGVTQPSHGDLSYVRDVFANPNNSSAQEIFLPIVCDGRFYPFLVERDVHIRVRPAQLVLI